jgi:hypothetical protein
VAIVGGDRRLVGRMGGYVDGYGRLGSWEIALFAGWVAQLVRWVAILAGMGS